ncbi:MAG: transposase [Oligoflexia bacterium]|nr:transposase [Oligoflexia bacterium]
MQIAEKLSSYLPTKKRNRGISSINKFLILLYSLIYGADCLDDIEDMREDPLFAEITGGGMAAITGGDFLRSFKKMELEELKEERIKIVIGMRESLFPKDKEIIVMMDSTPHEHYGKKFEAIEWNYKNMWCLDSLNCYDQYGFHYDFELRGGSTYSSVGAELMIRKIFKHVSIGFKKYFRADSAFSNLNIYNELINATVKFVIALKANVYKSILEKNEKIIKWKKKKIEFLGAKSCEMGIALYPLKGLAEGLKYLKVIFI